MSDFINWFMSSGLTTKEKAAESEPEKTKGGRGSGHHGHRGRPGKVGGSSPSAGSGGERAVQGPLRVTDEDDDAPREFRPQGPDYTPQYQPDKEGVLQNDMGQSSQERMANMLYRKVEEAEGFTFSPYHGFPDKGISVAIPGYEMIIKKGEFDPGDILQYVSKAMQEIKKDPRNHLGAWWDKDNGVVVLDVSRVLSSADEARRLGIQWKQRAGFNLETFETIYFDADEGRIAEGAKQVKEEKKGKGSKLERVVFDTRGKSDKEVADELVKWLESLGGEAEDKSKGGESA